METKKLQEEIIRLKKEKNVCILAHSYQSPEILEVADYRGDSYALSVQATKVSAKTIIMCGVLFMGETMKLLSPEKKIIMPVFEATCPMAEQISPERVVEFKAKNPTYKVVAYINTTAALKAVCDVCVTSSSAVKIVSALKEKDILFIPDKNLGAYVQEKCPDKNIVLWDGFCPVHNAIKENDCIIAKKAHPDALVLMHPEMPKEVLQYADHIGSTADILKIAQATQKDCIIGTEGNIAEFLAQENPEKNYYKLSKNLICPDMRLTSLADIYGVLAYNKGKEVIMSDDLREKAKRPIDEMLRLG